MSEREQFSEADKALLFDNTRDNVTRAAQVGKVGGKDLLENADTQMHAKISTTPDYSKKPKSAFGVLQIPEIDNLSLETRYVMFKDTADPGAILNQCLSFVSQHSPNCTQVQHEMKILGYVFEEVRFGLYALQLFKHSENLGLTCSLLDGFAPAIQKFWTDLKNSLTDAGFLEAEPESDFEDDFDDFYDSDSTFDLGVELDLSIPGNKYVNCSSDPTLVVEWAEDIKDPNYSTDTLLILAYNCEKAENLAYLMQTFAQQLFDAVIIGMTEAMEFSLPAIRCASVFLDHVAKNAKVSVKNEQLAVMIKQLANWTLTAKSDDAVTRSLEIATLLSQNLQTFSNLVDGPLNVEKELLEAVGQDCGYGTVKKRVNEFLSTIS